MISSSACKTQVPCADPVLALAQALAAEQQGQQGRATTDKGETVALLLATAALLLAQLLRVEL